MRARLAPQLLGPDHALLDAVLYRANWRAGYIRECVFTDFRPEVLAALCAAPAAVLLRSFTLTSARTDATAPLDAIARGVFADTLHDLTLSCTHASSLLVTPLSLAPLARLRRLALRGAYLTPGMLDRVAQLLVAPTSYDLPRLLPFATSTQFPAVTELVLDFSNLATKRVEDGTLEALLGRTFAPRLARFTLRAATAKLATRARRLAGEIAVTLEA